MSGDFTLPLTSTHLYHLLQQGRQTGHLTHLIPLLPSTGAENSKSAGVGTVPVPVVAGRCGQCVLLLTVQVARARFL